MDRQTDIKVTGSTPPILTDAQIEVERKRSLKARLASILDRGMVGDRLNVELPTDTYGEWVPNDKVEIYRYQTLGFVVDKKFASARALHSDGTEGNSIVGDVIFMTCPKEVKELIDEIRVENYDKVNSPKKSREEADFEKLAKTTVTPPTISSTTTSVNADEIKAAIIQS